MYDIVLRLYHTYLYYNFIKDWASTKNTINILKFLSIGHLHPPFLVLHEWIALVSELLLGKFFQERQRKSVLELIFDNYCLEVTVCR
jgi:hypothetical protein